MPHSQTRQLVSLYGKINNTLIYSSSYGQKMYTNPYTFLSIYADGMQDSNSSLTNTGKPFHGTTSQLLMLNIMQYNEMMAGDYTIVIELYCFYSTIYTLLPECNSNYYRKICNSLLFFGDLLDLIKEVSITTLSGFIIVIVNISIPTLYCSCFSHFTDVPQVIIQADNTVVQQRRDNDVTGLATLNCSAEGGNPEEYTVQLMKEGEQLMSTTSGPAVLLYSPSHYQQQFGLFTCSVVNEYFNINKSVLIQEQGELFTVDLTLILYTIVLYSLYSRTVVV